MQYKIKMIYTDPIKMRLPEGEAYLIEKLDDGKDLEWWKIKFVDTGYVCQRFIRKD